jgi:hypothetical protein
MYSVRRRISGGNLTPVGARPSSFSIGRSVAEFGLTITVGRSVALWNYVLLFGDVVSQFRLDEKLSTWHVWVVKFRGRCVWVVVWHYDSMGGRNVKAPCRSYTVLPFLLSSICLFKLTKDWPCVGCSPARGPWTRTVSSSGASSRTSSRTRPLTSPAYSCFQKSGS